MSLGGRSGARRAADELGPPAATASLAADGRASPQLRPGAVATSASRPIGRGRPARWWSRPDAAGGRRSGGPRYARPDRRSRSGAAGTAQRGLEGRTCRGSRPMAGPRCRSMPPGSTTVRAARASGLLLAGIGMNEAESDAAIRTLPGAVSLADIAVRGGEPARICRSCWRPRAPGHEYLIAVPLEPAGFPLNDPGPVHVADQRAAPRRTLQNLRWVLSRIDGYVGATGVIGTMRGERLAAMTDQMDAVLTELAETRPAVYRSARKAIAAPLSRAWGRHVDLVIDDAADQGVADRAMIDAQTRRAGAQAPRTRAPLWAW